MATKDSPEAEFLRLLPRIERTCRFMAGRYGLFNVDVDDFVSHVKLRLIENDYEILRKFEGRAKIETFLATVIANLACDYKISLTGKWRPPATAKRLGPVAVVLDRLLFREGHTLDQAWEVLTTNHHLPIARAELEHLAEQLPPRAAREFTSDDALSTVPSSAPAPDRTLIEAERRASAARVRDTLREVKQTLAPQDQVILAMRYEDGMKIADIAAALHLEARLLYRRIDGLHARLRGALEARGLGREAVAWFESDDGRE